MKIKNLKTWDEVKDKKYRISTLRRADNPEDFLYQDSNNLFTPVIHKEDFRLFQEAERSRWSFSRKV
jgi:hypothetical protein